MREAIILAAGYGKGLEPLTHTRHKVLVPVLGSSLLKHHLEILHDLGLENFIIVTSYLKEQLSAYLRRLSKDEGYNYVLVDQGEPLGTGHALLKALDKVSTEEVLIIYGDVYTSSDDIKQLLNAGGEAIGAAEVKDPENYGVIEESEGVLKGILEKPDNPPSRIVNAGIYVLRSDFRKYLEELEPSVRGEYELTDALTKYARVHPIKVVRISEWVDVGRPWKLLEVNRRALDGITKGRVKGGVESGAFIKGPLVVEEGAEIYSGSYIMGPVYIGKNAVVGPNAYLRPYSVVLEGAKVGFNVEVKESIIMERAHVAHQAYVGDSIVGEDSNLGAGTILANLRFDGREVPFTVKGVRVSSGRKKLGAVIGGHVKTGVNVSTFPGVKIGAYSWINPGLSVSRDVPPCVHVVANGEFKPLREPCPLDLSVWRS
jgi:UDP-N-acetylglucosamine diphosphorylase/glucosamine-1-phosphate N-acetyltransferase